MLSGSQPSSSTACPAYVLPEGPCPGAPDATLAPGHHRRSPRRAVSSQEVVGGRDETPFGADGAAAAASEAAEAAVELHLREDGLDHRLALSVELAAALAGQHASHEVVVAALPVASGGSAAAGVGRDQDLDAAIDDGGHLVAVPVAGIGQQHPGRVIDASVCEFSLG